MAISKEKMKFCNVCGEEVLNYIVYENAPIYKDCNKKYNFLKAKEKVPSEANMVQKILGVK